MINQLSKKRVVVRGAGDVASGVIRRLFLTGFEVIALEQPFPDCIRRTVCFAEAVYKNEITVEEVIAKLAGSPDEASKLINQKYIPILVDPDAKQLSYLDVHILIDARMLKSKNDTSIDMAPLVIGLGPGFEAGVNCHAAVETKRGFNLGRVLYKGSCQDYTGVPALVKGISNDRVWRSPAEGVFTSNFSIGDTVKAGEIAAEIAGHKVVSKIDGVIRGLARNGLKVNKDDKIGDVDPRNIKEYCFKISDKANAIAGGVLEAIFILQNDITKSYNN